MKAEIAQPDAKALPQDEAPEAVDEAPEVADAAETDATTSEATEEVVSDASTPTA